LATIKLYRETNEKGRLGRHEILLEMHHNEVGSPADSVLCEQIGNMELNGAFGDIELAGDLLVGEVEHERFHHFLFPATESPR
jgi:hypothetical protein